MRLRGRPDHARHSIAAWTRWDQPIVAAGTQEETGETWVNPSGGTAIDVFGYSYNADGELTAVSDDNSSYQYAYNADGEETSQGDVGSPHLPTVTLTYGYDADGDRTSMAIARGAWSATATTRGTS